MWRRLGVTAAFAVPAVAFRLTGTELPPGITVLVYGAGVVASAVLLSWAAEAAQVDISGSLAIAILALIAVLPEYAVDLYFAYTAGSDPAYTQYAAANMTGSNRLLIGIGWPLVAFVGFWAMRRARRRGGETGEAGEDRARMPETTAGARSADGAEQPTARPASAVGADMLDTTAGARSADGAEQPTARRATTAGVGSPTAGSASTAGFGLRVLGLRVFGRHREPVIVLPPRNRVELAFLAIASAYAFLIPLTRSIAWYDAVVLLALFGAYLWRVTREAHEEPELIGVAADIARLPRRPRRALVTGLFVAAAAIVVMAAEPFANGLIQTGETLGIDKFLLVQWLAPLSSEAPELIVATIFAWRLHAAQGLGMLLSAKVNQWTLLVGSLWIAYSLGGGGGAPLPLDERQTEEFLLTSAQALLAFAVLADLRFGLREAAAIFVLFVLQFPFPTTDVRLVFSAIYIVVAIALLVRRRGSLPPIFASLWRWERTTETDEAPV